MPRATTTAAVHTEWGSVYIHGDPDDTDAPVGLAQELGDEPVWLRPGDAREVVRQIERVLAERA